MAMDDEPKIPLPKKWTTHVRSAVLHVIGLAHYATVNTRSWAANSLETRLSGESYCGEPIHEG